jgi:hypothetical protein
MIIDIERLSALLHAVDRMAEALSTRHPAPTSFNCGEVDAVVEVLALAGHREIAADVLLSHVADDDLDDEPHADLVRARHHEAPASLRMRALAEVDSMVSSYGVSVRRTADPAGLFNMLSAIMHADGGLPGPETISTVTDWLAEHGYQFPEDECDGTPDRLDALADTRHGG